MYLSLYPCLGQQATNGSELVPHSSASSPPSSSSSPNPNRERFFKHEARRRLAVVCVRSKEQEERLLACVARQAGAKERLERLSELS